MQNFVVLIFDPINLILAAAMAEPSQRSATKTYVKPEAAVTVFELLMMGGVSPETF